MIFISYRKADTQAVVDSLAKELKKQFGEGQVFKDDQDLRAGDRWPDRLQQEVLHSQVLLAVIGKDWLSVHDEYGRRRIDDEDDWVRQEICTALTHKKRVIVLLVAPAVLPNKHGLPKDCPLQQLPELQHLPLRLGRDFDHDLTVLVKELAAVLPAPVAASEPVKTPSGGTNETRASDEPGPHNLPVPPRGFVGHAALLAKLRDELRRGGVIILKGQGGVGKTDLALAAAHAAYQDNEIPGGMVWINGELKLSLEGCLRQMAQVFFGDRLEQFDFARCGAQVGRHLQKCGPLVIFDYFDGHASDRELLHWLAEIRPPARVLVITRKVPPGLHGRVLNMDVLPRAEAMQMFINHASARGVNTQGQEKLVNELCQEVGDLPLAIQLLSARAVGVNLKRLLDRVRKGLDEIAEVEEDPSLPPRHKSARACYALSFEELSAEARALLLRLSVLPDGAGDDLITAVMGNEDWDRAAAELVRVSMWRFDDPRYTVQTLVRQFAREALGAGRAEAELRAARALAKLALEKANRTHPTAAPADLLDGLDWFTAEWRNLLACASFAEAGNDWPTLCMLTDSVFDFWHMRGYWTDAESLYSQALQASRSANDRPAQARFLNLRGKVYRHQGRWAQAESAFQESHSIARAIGDRVGDGQALYNLARIYQFQRRLNDAEAAAQQSLTILRAAGNRLCEAQALFRLGVVFRHQDRIAEARQAYQQSLAICRELGDRVDEGSNLNNLARIDQIEGRWPEAEAGYLQDLEICKQYRFRDGEGNVLKNLGSLYQEMGRLDDAEKVYQQSLAIRRELGDPVGQGETLLKLAELRLGQRKKTEAFELGRQALAILKTTEDAHRLQQGLELLNQWERSNE